MVRKNDRLQRGFIFASANNAPNKLEVPIDANWNEWVTWKPDPSDPSMVLHNISPCHQRFKCVFFFCVTLSDTARDLQSAKSSLLTSFCKFSMLPRFGSLSAVQLEDQE